MRIIENRKSIVVDGLLLTAVLTLLSMLLTLLISPIQGRFGVPGVMVFVLALLAVGVYCLDRGLMPGYLETQRAWYGAVGGLLGWVVVSLTDMLGTQGLTHSSAVIWLIFIGLVVWVLWRRVLPIGARFFFITLLMSWVAHFVLVAQEFLAAWLPVFERAQRFIGYLAIFGVLVGVIWLFLRARQRIQRMWSALWIWFALLIALSVFFGKLI